MTPTLPPPSDTAARRPVVRILAALAAGLALLGAGFAIGAATGSDAETPEAAAPDRLAFVADEGCDDIAAIVAEVSSDATIDDGTVARLGDLRGLVAEEMAPSVDRLVAAYEAVAAGDLARLADDAEAEAVGLAAEALTRHIEERCGIDVAQLGES